MAELYVVDGTKVECNCGENKTALCVPTHHNFFINGKAQANVEDYQPGANISPFGPCKQRRKRKPCILKLKSPWIGGKKDVQIDGSAALIKTSILRCGLGGTITVCGNAGQNPKLDKTGANLSYAEIPKIPPIPKVQLLEDVYIVVDYKPNFYAQSIVEEKIKGLGGSGDLFVAEYQAKLQMMGFDIGKHGIDGKYGNDTDFAIGGFQRLVGIPDCGELTPETVKAIDRALVDGLRVEKVVGG